MKNLLIGLAVLVASLAFVIAYQAVTIVVLSALHIGQNSGDSIGFSGLWVDVHVFVLAQFIPLVMVSACLIGRTIRHARTQSL